MNPPNLLHLLPMFITAFTVLYSWVGAHQGWGQLFEMHAAAVLCSCEASVCSCDCNCAQLKPIICNCTHGCWLDVRCSCKMRGYHICSCTQLLQLRKQPHTVATALMTAPQPWCTCLFRFLHAFVYTQVRITSKDLQNRIDAELRGFCDVLRDREMNSLGEPVSGHVSNFMTYAGIWQQTVIIVEKSVPFACLSSL